VIALVVLATIRVVHAQDRVPLSLEYEGAPGCTDADAFTREVLARAPRARIAAPAENARTLVARVRPRGTHGYDGVLVVRDLSAPATERAVHAPSCGELVTALAVIAAVVIDPMTARTGAIDAGIATADASNATGATDGGASANASANANANANANASASASANASANANANDGGAPSAPATAAGPPAADRPTGGRRRGSNERWEVSAGAGGGAIGGSAPTLLFSVPVFFEIAHTEGGVVEPALRVRFERTATASSEDGEFSRTGGAVDFCPIAFRARSLRAQPCARVELAALFAKGRDVVPVRSDVRPWFAAGPIGRARLELSGPFFLELEGGVMLAMVRDRFFVEPGTLVYRAPLVGATTAFALGLAF
jgi:hypothetical protein